MDTTYDLAVIGSGPAGYESAIRAAQLGLKTAIIENREIGGTCLNRGCIPTKAILHSSGLYREARNFREIGLSIKDLSFDFVGIMDHKAQTVSRLRGGIEQLLKANGITTLQGTGTVLGPNLVEVAGDSGTEEVKAANILIATGCTPSAPPIPGINLPGVVTSDGLLEIAEMPKRMVIIGGGVIGAEFATAFSDLGCDVTIIEALPRILSTMDREIAQNLSMIMKRRGVKIHTAARVEGIEEGSPLTCVFTEKESKNSTEADCVLVAVGRRPNTSGLFADTLGIKTEKGFIPTDEHHETDVKGIFAAGDVTGGIQLAHAASAEAIEAVEYIAGGTLPVRPRTIPSCVYTTPEIATAGLSADEAKQNGIETIVGKAITTSLGKSVIENRDRGFVKLVFEKETGTLIGAQLMCEHATDMISELVQAIDMGHKVGELVSVIHPHPTYSEGITEAVQDALGCAIHGMPHKGH